MGAQYAINGNQSIKKALKVHYSNRPLARVASRWHWDVNSKVYGSSLARWWRSEPLVLWTGLVQAIYEVPKYWSGLGHRWRVPEPASSSHQLEEDNYNRCNSLPLLVKLYGGRTMAPAGLWCGKGVRLMDGDKHHIRRGEVDRTSSWPHSGVQMSVKICGAKQVLNRSYTQTQRIPLS